MALFNSKDDRRHKTVKAADEVISSVISQEMRIAGELRFKGKTRIDGMVDGGNSR